MWKPDSPPTTGLPAAGLGGNPAPPGSGPAPQRPPPPRALPPPAPPPPRPRFDTPKGLPRDRSPPRNPGPIRCRPLYLSLHRPQAEPPVPPFAPSRPDPAPHPPSPALRPRPRGAVPPAPPSLPRAALTALGCPAPTGRSPRPRDRPLGAAPRPPRPRRRSSRPAPRTACGGHREARGQSGRAGGCSRRREVSLSTAPARRGPGSASVPDPGGASGPPAPAPASGAPPPPGRAAERLCVRGRPFVQGFGGWRRVSRTRSPKPTPPPRRRASAPPGGGPGAVWGWDSAWKTASWPLPTGRSLGGLGT